MSLNRPKVLVFCRPYLVDEFRDTFSALNDEFNFDFMTDGKHEGTNDTRYDFYKNLADGQKCAELSTAEIDDVRDRCRLLRELGAAKAHSMIHAMGRVLADALDRLKPGVVVSHLVDEYILHLLTMLASHRSIPTLAYCGSYFAGTALVVSNSLGCPLQARVVSDDEVASRLATISPAAFRQDYRQVVNYNLHYWIEQHH